MNKLCSLSILLSSSLSLCCASPRPPAPTQERQADLQRAGELLDHGSPDDVDEALRITDALLASNPDDPAARRLAGRGNATLVTSGRSHSELFLADAIHNYEQAVELQPEDAESWLALADLRLKNGDFANGRDAALTAAKVLKDHGASPTDVAKAVIAAADNEMQIFVDARQSEIDGGERPQKGTLELANAVLSRLAWAETDLPAEAHRRASAVYQWLDQDLKALDELERGIAAAPDASALHEAFLQAHARMQNTAAAAAAYDRMLREHGSQPMMLWYAGRAHAADADAKRKSGNRDAADRGYARAADAFARYASLQPQYADSANEWVAICELSRGRLALDAGDYEMARDLYESAYRVCPKVADVDENGTPAVHDAFGGNYLGGLDMIGQRLAGPGDARDRHSEPDLRKALAHYEWVIERHPDRFAMIYNDAGFTARELGRAIFDAAQADPSLSQQDRQQRMSEAMAVWERSYQLYQTATELAPDDPRIVNDTALMLVYHLHRDHQHARDLLEHAIACGSEQLAALPADAPAERRQLLDEAIGDAQENIAVLLWQQGRPFEDYESFLRKAVEHYPFGARRAAEMLRTRGEARPDDLYPAPDAAAAAPSDTAQDPQPASASKQDGQDPRAADFAPIERKARARADVSDYDGALLILDGAAKEFGDYAPYRQLAGTYSLRYAEQAMREQKAASLIDGLLADAAHQLEQAVQLDPELGRAWLDLARTQSQRGDFAAAVAAAGHAVPLMKGESEEALQQAHQLRAQAGARVLLAAKEGDDVGDALAQARESFQWLQDHGGLAADQRRAWTFAELAAKDGKVEQVWQPALERSPDSTEMLDGMVTTLAEANHSDVASELLADRDDALGIWYRGKAQWNLGNERYRQQKYDDALKAYDAAIASFEEAKRQNPDYTANTDPWIAFAKGQKGIVLLAQQRPKDAEKPLLEAAELAPSHIEEQLGSGYTIKQGIQFVADALMKNGDTAGGVDVYRQATAAAPSDSDLANNHGLFARDYGVQLQRQGKEQQAKEMFEQSYASYSHAMELEPDNVQLINDRALMLVYHLQRDWDLAKDLLDQAIAKGEARLRDQPPSDAQEKQALQSAIGDAYENLGYYLEKHVGDLTAAKTAYEKSVSYPPFQSRQSARYLQRVEAALAKRSESSGELEGNGGGEDKDK